MRAVIGEVLEREVGQYTFCISCCSEKDNRTEFAWFGSDLAYNMSHSPTTGIIWVFQMKFPTRTRWGYSGAILWFVEINNVAKASEIIKSRTRFSLQRRNKRTRQLQCRKKEYTYKHHKQFLYNFEVGDSTARGSFTITISQSSILKTFFPRL